MIHKMFVIYDSKANAYMQPWFLTQQAMAQRAFADCVNDAEHNFGRHPEDYTLFTIGEFDDQSAKIKWISPISFGNGIQYKQTKTEDEQLDFLQHHYTNQLANRNTDAREAKAKLDGEKT